MGNSLIETYKEIWHRFIGRKPEITVVRQCIIFPSRPLSIEQKLEILLKLWGLRSLRAARCHYLYSEMLFKRNTFWTVTNALVSVFILFLVNAPWIFDVEILNKSLTHESANYIYKFFSGISGAALVITALYQYIRRFEANAYEHKHAGSEYSNLHRKIERYLISDEVTKEQIHLINNIYSHLTKNYPLVPKEIWRGAEVSSVAKEIEELEKDAFN
ncbi:MAG: hypothetical protein HC779_07245 [Phyllobacteriaceae bacterium]|nr:hypothetical protein [Phyllobacteriaceae bacterium]